MIQTAPRRGAKKALLVHGGAWRGKAAGGVGHGGATFLSLQDDGGAEAPHDNDDDDGGAEAPHDNDDDDGGAEAPHNDDDDNDNDDDDGGAEAPHDNDDDAQGSRPALKGRLRRP